MRSVIVTLASLVIVAAAVPACAQSPQPAVTDANGITTTHQFVKTRGGGEKVTCEDFLDLADQFKPQAISYVLGVSKGRDPTVKFVDVSTLNTVVPVVVNTCRSRPKGALADTVSTILYAR